MLGELLQQMDGVSTIILFFKSIVVLLLHYNNRILVIGEVQ